jgi:3'(2'), 5'-bisphosphate nucleotidase
MMEQIIGIARKAGLETLKYYSEEIEVNTKSDDSPLTKADLASNKVITESLIELYPDIPIISEEAGIPDFEERSQWKRYFLVDPLDGTKEFIKKNDEFTVNIALIEDGVPVLGVVYAPALNLLYYGSRQDGSFMVKSNQERVRIYSEPADKSQPLSIIESRSHGSQALEDYLEGEGIMIRERIKSGSSLKICLVADGTADIYPRMGPTMEWDVAAGDAVYRYSARNGVHDSGLIYNKENLLNPNFVIGI